MTPGWSRALPLAALSDRLTVGAECRGRRLCLALVDGAPVAVEDRCPHRDIALSGGVVRDGVLTCPGHFRRFDLRTGRCLQPAEPVAAYPCRVVAGWVEVLVPDPAPVRSVRETLLAAARARAAPPA